MRTCKIVDTCTLINLFCEGGPDVSQPLMDYDVIITETVVDEYTRKYPRQIPSCITVMEMTPEDMSVMEDLELLMPMLGPGERSVYAIMVRLSGSYDSIVMLTDDKKASKKLRGYTDLETILPSNIQIKWCDSKDLVDKFTSDGKIRTRCLRSRARSVWP